MAVRISLPEGGEDTEETLLFPYTKTTLVPSANLIQGFRNSPSYRQKRLVIGNIGGSEQSSGNQLCPRRHTVTVQEPSGVLPATTPFRNRPFVARQKKSSRRSARNDRSSSERSKSERSRGERGLSIILPFSKQSRVAEAHSFPAFRTAVGFRGT